VYSIINSFTAALVCTSSFFRLDLRDCQLCFVAAKDQLPTAFLAPGGNFWGTKHAKSYKVTDLLRSLWRLRHFY
jgi:hypothetical protein